jgi:hypothetical protein
VKDLIILVDLMPCLCNVVWPMTARHRCFLFSRTSVLLLHPSCTRVARTPMGPPRVYQYPLSISYPSPIFLSKPPTAGPSCCQ